MELVERRPIVNPVEVVWDDFAEAFAIVHALGRSVERALNVEKELIRKRMTDAFRSLFRR